jgi:predicted O-methyltransferase YrrM
MFNSNSASFPAGSVTERAEVTDKSAVADPLTPFPWTKWLQLTADCLDSEFMTEMQARRRDTESVSHTLGRLDAAALYALVRLARPRVVVETGTYRGMSAAFILQALSDENVSGFSVTSIERNSGNEIGMLVPERLRPHFLIQTGDVRRLIERKDALPASIDFFFHDSSHRYEHQMWEFSTFWPRVASGGFLASHDVHMNASFAEFVARSYQHHEGKTDWNKTTHAEWGRLGMLGFMRKSLNPITMHGN